MSTTSKIEWTEATWNPVTGCTPISPGCEHCYARTMTKRLQSMGQAKYSAGFDKVVCHPECLDEPLRWKKPRMVFVCSMADLFHEDVPDEFSFLMFDRMSAARQHTFLVLTKRPQRMRDFILGDFAKWRQYFDDPIVPNVWLGVTVCNQEEADAKIPILLQIPAAKHFASVEPMLGAVDLTRIKWARIPVRKPDYKRYGVPAPGEIWSTNNVLQARPADALNPAKIGLNWTICGGETGPGARPMHPDWVRGLRDQCVDAGVPFFFKSWGDWVKPEQMREDEFALCDATHNCATAHRNDYYRVGKKRAGRILDGRTWDEMPEAVE